MRSTGSRRRLLPSIKSLLQLILILTGIGFIYLTLRPVDPASEAHILKFTFYDSKSSSSDTDEQLGDDGILNSTTNISLPIKVNDDSGAVNGHGQSGHSSWWTDNIGFEAKGDGGQRKKKLASCATVEEMGEVFGGDESWKESIRVRKLIQRHFEINGASRVRALPPRQFCNHGFVIGKASEAGFGNEMYKILTSAALSVMLNRSLIIGQNRGKYPFGDYISYTEAAFTLKEVKSLWRKNGCVSKYGHELVVRVDDFQKPARTNVLCSNWIKWTEPIIWIQNTTDAVAAQFFLKNVNPEIRKFAVDLFGKPELLQRRPNVFGELMRVLISASPIVDAAVKSVLVDGNDPDMSLHMRMLMSRSVRAARAALKCVIKSISNLSTESKPKMVLVSDNPTFIRSIKPAVSEFAEVIHFDYENFRGNISNGLDKSTTSGFRVKDWGPAPRWVAFVDFFLASRAKHAVISGAHRRVGTTYAQLIAALAAAQNLDENAPTVPKFSFLSSFQSHLLENGLGNQIGWGHVWNKFAGPLSCRGQTDQCALTPLLPPAWWDGIWQSPRPQDIERLEAYGVLVSALGTIDEEHLSHFCRTKKISATRLPVSAM